MPRLLSCALFFCLFAASALAQGGLSPRYGVGFDALLSVASGEVVEDGFGLGVRGRVSFPVNADFSFAVGAGLAGFLLGGRDDATYLFNPQLSGVLTLPRSPRWARYLIGGFGGYFPLGSSDKEGGPSLHLGLGWAQPLNETSLYIELDPAIVIGETRTAFIAAARVGVIF
ncbi:MAG: hypothetical protein AAGI91_16200 [Bacteroidota bacterium]